MIYFNIINEKSFKLTTTLTESNTFLQKETLHTLKNKYKNIKECSDPICKFNRQYTNIREIFEKKIMEDVKKKNFINILFYASYLLWQEVTILLPIIEKVKEIHLFDIAYADLFSSKVNNLNNKDCLLAINQFVHLVKNLKNNIDIYVHTDPTYLKTGFLFKRRFDIVCGIDMDFFKGNFDYFSLLKEIASHSLKINGSLYQSQSKIDLLEISKYKISFKGFLIIDSIEHFVFETFYLIYRLNVFAYKLKIFIGFVGIIFSILFLKYIPVVSILIGTYGAIDVIYKFLFKENLSTKIKIEKYENILKN